MDQIREQVMYNDNKVHICMKTLTSQEQYECIRLFLAKRTKDVYVCSHGSVNGFVEAILTKLGVEKRDC
jgi:hypothetical protein